MAMGAGFHVVIRHAAGPTGRGLYGLKAATTYCRVGETELAGIILSGGQYIADE